MLDRFNDIDEVHRVSVYEGKLVTNGWRKSSTKAEIFSVTETIAEIQ